MVKNNSLKDENIKVETLLSEGLNIIRTQINNGNIIEESNLTKKEMSIYLKQDEAQEIFFTYAKCLPIKILIFVYNLSKIVI